MQHSARKLDLHLWFPNIFEFKGGIQLYLDFFLKALENLDLRGNYHVFLKHDTCSSPKSSFKKDITFHFAGNWTPSLRTPLFASQILGYGLLRSPNLIIAGHLNFAVAAYWLKRLTGVPYWVLVYGMEAWDIKRPALKRALQHADRILSISHYTRDRLLKEQNIAPEKILILPCCFDASRFKIAPKPQNLLNRHNLAAEQPIILTVARLDDRDRHKGYDQILQALPTIQTQIPNVHYIIVGKGADRPRIEQLITELNLQDCVTLAGFIPDSELGDYYNLCDVFAMPSKKEGFGIVYLEALACGKPTLGGNQDGAIDALCHGELGVLVDPDDIGVLAQTLIQILERTYPHKLIYQPEALREQVIERFDFERFKETVAEHFQQHAKFNSFHAQEF